ncbi:MAG TPA: hypothetical protein VG246_13210 [Acidimicrobiales bacterium]|jgi:hypothetical protein|nr:hypothetical protein [Acidimicrobiales bacterium]
MAGRQQGFSGAAVETTLTAPIDDAELTFQVQSVTGWPASGLPFTVTLDQGSDTIQETVLVDSYSGLTVTVDTLVGRGYDGTTPQSHAEGAAVVHTLDAAFCADLSARAFATTTKGDIPIVSTTTGVVMGRLPISGTQFQTVGAGAAGLPAYQDSAKSKLSTLGDLLYASGANALARLGIGSTGKVLTVVGGLPAWAAIPAVTPVTSNYVESYITADSSALSAETNITSVALGAGTWLITARALFTQSSASVNTADLWIGPTSVSATGAYAAGSCAVGNLAGAAQDAYVTITKVVVLASPTTVYMEASGNSSMFVLHLSKDLSIGNVSGITAVQIA